LFFILFIVAGLQIGFYHCVSYELETKRYNQMFAPFKNPIFLACLTIIAMIIFSIPMIIDAFYPTFGDFVHSHTPALWAIGIYHIGTAIWWSITLIILSDNYSNSQKSAQYLCCAMLRSVLCICKGFFGLLYVYLIRILCLLPLALIGVGIHVSKVHSIAFFIVYPILILIAIAYLVYMLPFYRVLLMQWVLARSCNKGCHQD